MNDVPIILIDYYAALNLGDDLFLKTIVSRYPSTRFIVKDGVDPDLALAIQADNLLTTKCLNNRKHQKSFFSKRAEFFCQIGGSIFIEPGDSGLIGTLKSVKMIFIRRQMYSSAHHVFILGANWGPCRHRFFKAAFHSLFYREIEDICFRDTASYSEFNDLSNVRYAPDILFSLKMPSVEKKRSVLFSVISLSGRASFDDLTDRMYISWVTNAAIWFHRRGYEIILSSFCKREGDEETVDLVGSRLTAERIPFFEHRYRGDVDGALEIIASCEVVVATRFHAMVLGIDAGARVLPVPYSMKTVNVLKDIGFDMRCVQMIDAIDPDDMSICERTLVSDPFPLDGLPERAEEHFRVLDCYLGRR